MKEESEIFFSSVCIKEEDALLFGVEQFCITCCFSFLLKIERHVFWYVMVMFFLKGMVNCFKQHTSNDTVCMENILVMLLWSDNMSVLKLWLDNILVNTVVRQHKY